VEIRLSNCRTVSTNHTILPIEGCLEVFHIDLAILKRSRLLIRILTPLEEMSP
jgi:hypothetical protein